MRACPIPMATATTARMSTRPQHRITPVAGLTTPMVVTTQLRAGITHRLHGITSHRRVITTSRGFINRRRAITTIAATRIADGTVMTAVVGMVVATVGAAIVAAIGAMILVATVGGITVAEEAIMATTMAEAAVANSSIESGA